MKCVHVLAVGLILTSAVAAYIRNNDDSKDHRAILRMLQKLTTKVDRLSEALAGSLLNQDRRRDVEKKQKIRTIVEPRRSAVLISDVKGRKMPMRVQRPSVKAAKTRIGLAARRVIRRGGGVTESGDKNEPVTRTIADGVKGRKMLVHIQQPLLKAAKPRHSRIGLAVIRSGVMRRGGVVAESGDKNELKAAKSRHSRIGLAVIRSGVIRRGGVVAKSGDKNEPVARTIADGVKRRKMPARVQRPLLRAAKARVVRVGLAASGVIRRNGVVAESEDKNEPVARTIADGVKRRKMPVGKGAHDARARSTAVTEGSKVQTAHLAAIGMIRRGGMVAHAGDKSKLVARLIRGRPNRKQANI